MRFFSAWGAVLALVLTCGQALAQDCTPKQLGSFEMNSSGGVVLPVTLDGSPQNMILQMSAYGTALFQDTVDELQLHTRALSSVNRHVMGQELFRYAVVNQVDIGGATEANQNFFVIPQRRDVDPKIAGFLSLDELAGYDVEMNMPDGKFELFVRSPCKGPSWSQPFSTVPMQELRSGNRLFPVTLDGHVLQVTLNTATEFYLSDLNKAAGLTVSSPGMTLIRKGASSRDMDLYSYTFKSLALGDVAVSNVQAVIRDDMSKSDCHNYTNCYGDEGAGTISVSDLPSLKLYMAFAEQKIYVSH